MQIVELKFTNEEYDLLNQLATRVKSENPYLKFNVFPEPLKPLAEKGLVIIRCVSEDRCYAFLSVAGMYVMDVNNA